VSVAVDTATQSLGDAGSHTPAPHAAEPNTRIYRNLGALGGGQAATWLVTLAWTLVVPRILGPAGIGVIVTAISVAGIFGVLLGLGTRNYLVREIVVAPDTAPRLVGTALVLRLVMVPLFCVATVAYTIITHTPRDQTIVIYLASAAALVLLICEPYQAGFQAAERMEYLAYGDVINKTGQSVVGILLAVVGIRAVGITASWVAVALVVLVATHAWWSRLSRVELRTTPGELARMLRGSAAYWAFGVFFLIYLWIDTVMLSLMTNPQTVGYYGVPTRLFQTMMFLPVMISTAWLPRLVHAFEEDPRHLRRVARQPVEVVLILGLPIGAATIVFAGPVLGVLYGPAYRPAVGVMMLLGLCIPPIFLNIMLNQVLIAAKRQSTWTWVMLGATIVNPLLNLALIPYTQTRYHNGALGAAASLVATEILIVAVGLVLVGHHVITATGVRRVTASAVASAAMVAAGLGTRSFGIGVSIVCAVVGFAAVGALVGLVTPGKIRDARRGFASLRGRPELEPAAAGPAHAHEVAAGADPIPGDPLWALDGVAASGLPVQPDPVWAIDHAAADVAHNGHDPAAAADAGPERTRPRPPDRVRAAGPAAAGMVANGHDPGPAPDDPADDPQRGTPDPARVPDPRAVSVPPIRPDAVPAPDLRAVSVPPIPPGPIPAHTEAAATAAPNHADPDGALARCREVDDLLRRVGDTVPTGEDPASSADLECQLAERARAEGRRQDAELGFGRALALARDAAAHPSGADPARRRAAEAVAGRALIGLGQPEAALDHLKLSVLAARNAGDRGAEGGYLIDTARALGAAGRTRDGRTAIRRAVGLLEDTGDRDSLGRALETASALSEDAGDLAAALAEQRRADALRHGLEGEPARAGGNGGARRAVGREPRASLARRPSGAMVDKATGLPNRRYFDARLAELVAGRSGPVALAVFDLNRSLRTNSGGARPVPDEVMRACARVLCKSTRDPDLVARFGPAELAVVLPGIELASALAICQRMRRAIAEFPWDTVQPGLTVTASVGCVIGRPGGGADDMLARADRQLAAAKDLG